jgi:hypothetical protein
MDFLRWVLPWSMETTCHIDQRSVQVMDDEKPAPVLEKLTFPT